MVEKMCPRAVAHIPGANIKEFLGTIRMTETGANRSFEQEGGVFGTKGRR